MDFKYEKAKGTRNGPGTLSALLAVLPQSLKNTPPGRVLPPASLVLYLETNVVIGTASGNKSSS